MRMRSCREEKANEQTVKNADAADAEKIRGLKAKERTLTKMHAYWCLF